MYSSGSGWDSLNILGEPKNGRTSFNQHLPRKPPLSPPFLGLLNSGGGPGSKRWGMKAQPSLVVDARRVEEVGSGAGGEGQNDW